MKDDFLHKGIRGLRDMTLSPEEKQAVLSRLSEYMEKNPPMVAPQRQSVFDWLVPAFRFEYAIASALVVFLVASGSAAVAAEGALPGDILYPVKVRIAEPLRGVLIVGDVSKARWEAGKTVRRLEEAETLAAQGRLDRASVQTVKSYFEKSTNEFDTIIRDAEAKGLSEALVNASVDFEAEISAHSQILSAIREHAGSSKSDDIAPLQSAVEESAHKAWERRVNVTGVFLKESQSKRKKEIQENGGKSPSVGREDEARKLFDDRAQSVQLMINETKIRLESTKASVGAAGSSVQENILERVPRELQKAEDALRDAREKRDSGDSDKAFSTLLDSESSTKQVDISLQQWLKFDKEESENQSRQSGSGSNGSGDGSSGRNDGSSGQHPDDDSSR